MRETCPIGHLMEKDPQWSMAVETQYFVCKICKFHRKASREQVLEELQISINNAIRKDTSHIRNLSQNA